jgi:hypothetical protein
MADDKKGPTDQQRIAKLEQLVASQALTITRMLQMGGFADSKTLGIRCTRIEERLALTELDGDMLKDVAAQTTSMFESHLANRHQANINRLDGPDVAAWCRIRKRMREWAEKRGLMTKRRDVTDTRHDENRARPRPAVSA